MAVIAGLTNSFKKEILEGVHDLSANTLKIALFTDDADLTPGTTAYSTGNEVTSTNYTAGGNTLEGNVINQSGSTVYVDFDDTDWSSVSFSVRGALIYNSSKSDKSVAVLDFGLSIDASSSTFTVKFPTADVNDAIIRIQ